MIKKILAGVLTAASILTVSASAFAADVPSDWKPTDDPTAVTKPAQTSYKVNAGLLDCTLDVEIPTSIKAFINPYGSSVHITDGADTEVIATGVTSYAYVVTNKSLTTQVGVDLIAGMAEGKGDVEYLSATDYTACKAFNDTTSVADQAKYAGKKAYAWLLSDKGAADQTKAATQTAINTALATAPTADKAGTTTAGGAYIFTEDEKSLENFMVIAKSTAADTPSNCAFAFGGFCKNFKDASGEKEDWTNKDSLAINFAFKVHP